MKIGDRVSTFFRELKRRKVYRVTAVYLVLAIGGRARASALSEGLDAAARGDTPGTRSVIERLDAVEAHFEAALLRVDRAFSALRSAHPLPWDEAPALRYFRGPATDRLRRDRRYDLEIAALDRSWGVED